MQEQHISIPMHPLRSPHSTQTLRSTWSDHGIIELPAPIPLQRSWPCASRTASAIIHQSYNIGDPIFLGDGTDDCIHVPYTFEGFEGRRVFDAVGKESRRVIFQSPGYIDPPQRPVFTFYPGEDDSQSQVSSYASFWRIVAECVGRCLC
jgi:hypothetical protein